MKQRHDLIQIKPKNKIFNFLYANITYYCKLCKEIITGNLGENPNEHHKNCDNYAHFCKDKKQQ